MKCKNKYHIIKKKDVFFNVSYNLLSKNLFHTFLFNDFDKCFLPHDCKEKK